MGMGMGFIISNEIGIFGVSGSVSEGWGSPVLLVRGQGRRRRVRGWACRPGRCAWRAGA